MTDFEVDFYIKAFFQSKELRTKCISNIDQQVNTIRTVFISLLVALLTVVFTNNINWLLLLSIMMTFLFWCVESRCKQNQRGYIYVSNQLEKELSQTIGIGGEEEIIRLAEKYAFDLNGFVANKKNNDYKNACSFRHTMWMRNVRSFYIWLLLLQILLLVVIERVMILTFLYDKIVI